MCLSAQEADTLNAASVTAIKDRPIVKPVEEVDIGTKNEANVADVIRRFTGVQIKDYGGAGGLKTVNVRSLGSEHVGIFLDGIQIDNAQNMQVDLGRFSTDGIGTISLYNGQKERRLQSAKEYASGATVHLSTQKPKEGLILRLKGGSFLTLNPSLQWDAKLGRRLALRTSASFLTSNGKYKYPYFDTTLVRENGDITALRIEEHLFGEYAKGDWNIHAYAYGSERGFPGPVIRRASGFPLSAERQADEDLFLQGGWNGEWTERFATSVKFKYSNNYTHYCTHPERNPMAMPYDLHYRQLSAYLSFAESFTVATPLSIDFSADGQYNALDSDVGQFVKPQRATLTSALAARLTWDSFRAAAHIVYMGAWDFFKAQNAGGWTRENAFRDAWMPSVSLYWAPLEWLEADVFAKRSYRLPSFNDLYYSLMGNSALVPESASQFGADVHLDHTDGRWHWQSRISPYYNKVDEKIVAIPTASQFRWTMLNIGRVDISGLDVKASSAYSGKDWSVSATLRYSLQSALDHSEPGSLTYDNQIPYIPLHSGSIGFEGRYREWSFSWDTSFSGEKWSRSANTADYRIAPWCLGDARLARTFLDGRLIGSLNLNNVFGTRYQIVQGYPMPGANFSISVEYRL